LAQGRLRPHKVTRAEVHDNLALVGRDLQDAAVQGLSSERRFLIAYEAGLRLATIPLHCAGFETYGTGHHWATFQVLPEVMGVEFGEVAEYLEACRTKRNVGTYDRVGEISASEAAEITGEVTGFKGEVEQWLAAKHPDLI
jgi:hypothetical protein